MQQHRRASAAGLVLREFYDRYYRPDFLLDMAPGTLAIYGQVLDRWEQLTSNPPLEEIDNETLANFKARLRDPDGIGKLPRRSTSQMTLFDLQSPPPLSVLPRRRLAPATVNRHLRQLQAILGKAGPAGPGNRDALGVLQNVPWTRLLREPRRLPRDVSGELLEAIYRATLVAVYPDCGRVDPSYWWKALLITALTVGFRTGTLLSLRWSDIDWQTATLRCQAESDKCGSDRVKPVSQLVLKHLLRIRTDAQLVFPWNRCETTFYRQWWRIQDAADIRPRDRIKIHDLKRACGTRFAAISSAWVVQKRLDHSSLATSQFYVNATREEREAVERMPIPAAFAAEFSGTETDAGA